MRIVRIGDRLVGGDAPVMIIAEAGVNHNGDVKLAHELIDVAAKAGADAVKFQSFITEELVTMNAAKAEYQVTTTGSPGRQYEMLKALELTAEEQASLKAHCEELGILYLCTPYETISVDMLDRLGVVAFKIASTDTTNVPFLKYVASKGRPVILSTGMSTLGEVEMAVEALRAGGLGGQFILLHCVSEYPAPIQEANLRAMRALAQAFGCPVGYSDHTRGIGAAPWAVAAGACVVEKHYTLDRKMPGPDHRASLEPKELTQLVRNIREVERSLGDGIKRPTDGELRNKVLMQKSLVASREIRAGEQISPDAVTCKRPGTGLAPHYFDVIVGHKAVKAIAAGEVLTFGSIDWTE